jgi:hypothetical protein
MPFGIRPSNVRVCHFTTRADWKRKVAAAGTARKEKTENDVAAAPLGHRGDTVFPPSRSPFSLISLSLDRVPFGKLFLADGNKLTDAVSLSTKKLAVLISRTPERLRNELRMAGVLLDK